MSEAGPTRERILVTAERLFAEHGFRRVSVRDICRAARVNVAAINYHFGDKAGLYREVVQAAIDAMRGTTEAARRAGEGLPAEQRLGRYVAVFVGRLLARGSGRVQRLFHKEMSDPTPELDRLLAQGVRPRLEYLSSLVAEIMDCPVSDPRVLRCVFSIQSQSLAVVPNLAAARLGFAPTAGDAEAIADHITRFSLEGIRGLARRRAARRGQRRRPL
ncbi:MAG TPA: CerR family C-terminal domain-containing protein [Vicinamibacteria bacterium]|nr:CerR family C-terminal domain-containing protein [Vicinamibacteria bacterium]